MLPFSDWEPFEHPRLKKERQKITQEKINKLINRDRRRYFQGYLDRNDHSVAPQLDYELNEQQDKVTKIHQDISAKRTTQEKISVIMAIEDARLREYMIREYTELFRPKPKEEKMIYDEVTGVNLPEEVYKRKKRERIMAIEDEEIRLLAIQQNPEVFKNIKQEGIELGGIYKE